MARQGNTTAVGLGWAVHQKPRMAALAALRDGDPCPRCGLPMYRWMVTWNAGRPTSRWLDFDDFPGRAFGGPQVKRLAHRRCNRRAGAMLGNRLQRRRRTPRRAAYTRW